MTHDPRAIAEKALIEIAKYPTCLTPVLIAMEALDKLGVRHRGGAILQERQS